MDVVPDVADLGGNPTRVPPESPSQTHVFARCTVCTHASMYKPGTPCRMCEGEVAEVPAPADLWSGWRCSCFHCVITLC